METTAKRYAVTAFAKNDPANFVQYVTTADDYKTAWQNARAAARFGETVERLADGAAMELKPSAYIVRDVQSLEKRQRKQIEPTVSDWFEFCETNGIQITKRQRDAYAELKTKINAADETDADDSDADANADAA